MIFSLLQFFKKIKELVLKKAEQFLASESTNLRQGMHCGIRL